MKRVLLTTALLLLVGSFAFAATGQDPHLLQHDFAIMYQGGTVNTYQGCRGCHVPHGGAIAGDTTQPYRNTVFGTATTGDPSTGANKLWDKLIATGAWQTYSSDNVPAAMLQAPTTSTDPAWHSYLCFSCHDGTTAQLNIPSGLVATDNFLMNGGNGDIDLTNDHPVDIAWPATDTANYETIANVTGGTSTFNSLGMPLYGADKRVECATCHNPHLQPTTTNGGSGNFLRVATVTDNTSLCRTCHLSKR